MKFGKRLQRLLEDSLPDWRVHFISYKRLKSSLKLIVPADENPLCFSQHCSCTATTGTCPQEHLGSLFCRRLHRPEAVFMALLFSELNKVNTFFQEKEEEFVIRSQEIKGNFDKILKSSNGNLELNPEIIEVRKAIVNIHGEMVLLENYSALNYTGLVKIIKKHDKRTGGVLRMPFIQRVLQEPFFATDIISRLVQECEEMLQLLFPHSSFSVCRPLNGSEKHDGYSQQDSFLSYFEVSEAFVGDDNVERICKNTLAAWRIMREFRKGSSTYSLFSIPPFEFAQYEEGPCCKSVIAEQHCWYPEVPVGPNS